MCGVTHNVGAFADAVCGVYVYDSEERDSDDLPSCPQYPL